jgi:hypothetical protein
MLNPFGRLQAPEPGHGDIDNNQVRVDGFQNLQEFHAIAGFPHDFQVAVFLDDLPDTLAHQSMVISQDDFIKMDCHSLPVFPDIFKALQPLAIAHGGWGLLKAPRAAGILMSTSD